MGYYTKLVLNATLKYDTPEEIIKLLEYMFGNYDEKPDKYKDLIDKSAISMVPFGSSAYFMGATSSKLVKKDDRYEITINSSIKNYNNEYQNFIEIIEPYIKYDEFLGYIIGEDDKIPTLIYKSKNGIKYKNID